MESVLPGGIGGALGGGALGGLDVPKMGSPMAPDAPTDPILPLGF